MAQEKNVYIYILVMAVVTYLIRMIPVTFFRKEITGRFMKSFLHYVPYACLAAMTFPAILTAPGHLASGVAALVAALVAACKERSLLTVALCACAAAFLAETAFLLAG